MKTIAKRLILFLGFAAATGFFTYSYFSDTETSTGNTFAAGKLDLIVNVDNNQPFTNNLFNLLDMKPGDPGEKTVKIKVEDNPACGTVAVNLTSDLDNSCTEPEGQAENATGNNDCNTAGELNDALNFGIFADANCNNIYETGDIFLTQGTLTGNVSYNIGELGTTEKCYGVGWCFGTMTVNETAHTIACDGSLLGNISQTDSFTADLVVTALQKRNQFDEGCPVDGAVSPTCTPTTEICGNQIDEDCNGNDLQCAPACIPTTEVCDGIDNNCDLAIDEGNPGGGGACSTGLSGICSTGTLQCNGIGLTCVQNSIPATEICGNGIDEDCNGSDLTCQVAECSANTDCVDGNPCTTDTCFMSTCTHNPITGNMPGGLEVMQMCPGSVSGTCSSGIGSCNPSPFATSCNDNNLCTDDTGIFPSCTYTAKNCDDGNIFNTDACNTANGQCYHFCTNIACSGFSIPTFHFCSLGVCF